MTELGLAHTAEAVNSEAAFGCSSHLFPLQLSPPSVQICSDLSQDPVGSKSAKNRLIQTKSILWGVCGSRSSPNWKSYGSIPGCYISLHELFA